ncbi:MAG: excinuclease ABC subunit UvrC [Wenzhouxiangellaceae bacterium]
MSSEETAEFDGAAVARELGDEPGVYLFRDRLGKLLYVGKARHLRRRVGSYFDQRDKGARLNRMINQIAAIEVSVTRSEAEALLLENEWIKTLKPRYNIRLRDDKSYPYLRLTSQHSFPRVSFYRGSRRQPGEYFGPFASASAVRDTLNSLHRVFRLRQCEDSIFRNRSRPCLQYQIKRCSAPCVGLVDAEQYAADVAQARLFLQGRSAEVQSSLGEAMEAAAARQDYEQAAQFRDRIQALSRIQTRSAVAGQAGDCDVIAIHVEGGLAGVAVQTIRDGRNQGSRTYYPDQAEDMSREEVAGAFLGQYYVERLPPAQILINQAPAELELWQQALGERASRQVKLISNPRGERLELLRQAEANAGYAVRHKLSEQAGISERLQALAELLKLDQPPARIECFDISHLGGTETVASCVVCDDSGLRTDQYRRFNIKNITGGDDYAAMRQVVKRRYQRLVKEEGVLPEVIVIDGGSGQLKAAQEVLAELGLDHLFLMSIAKGVERRRQNEIWLFADERQPLRPNSTNGGAHLLQQLRDEAHRFAITGQRKRRQRSREHSSLEDVAGIGPKRRRDLLRHFGGLHGVKNAKVDELAAVPGINRSLAERIKALFE